MSFFSRLTAVVLASALTGPIVPLQARTRQGDKDLSQGRAFEEKKEWDKALDSYRKALAADPSDLQYQMATQKARFQASQFHVENGQKVRAQGSLAEALLEFQRAFAIDPGSIIAVQEVRTTQDMIQRERQRIAQTGQESSPEVRALTPQQEMQAATDERLDRILPVAELRPLGPKRFDLKINSNIPKTLFETLGAFAGINVLWDSDMTPANTAVLKNGSVNFQNSTLNEALDYLAVVTKFFWKPMSSNTIFVTNDTRAKRTDYADQVLKIFYLTNPLTAQELAEIVNAVRTVADIQKMFAYSEQNAIVARGDADQIGLVEKMIHDLDRPRSEVVVDIIVMQTSSNYSRQLAAALMPTGLNMPAAFTPTNGLQVTTPATTNSSGAAVAASTTTGTSIPLSSLGHLASADWSTTLPSGLLEAVMSDSGTKILQAPQVRSVDNGKAILKIGQKEPTASGSFGSALGLSGAGVSPLVNTQFTYLDIGVNVELTPRVHDNGDVSLHVDLEISSVDGTVNLGGISEPIIAQKKVTNDIRLREGEVSLLGGLIDVEEDTTKTGVPGLVDIPLLGRLFRSDSITKTRSELMIALVPHVVRRPVYTAENLRTIDVGTANTIHLSYAPKPDDGGAASGPGVVLTPAPPPDSAPSPFTPPAQWGGPPGLPSSAAPVQTPVAPPPGQAAPPTAPGFPPGLPFPLQQLMRPGPGGVPGMPPGSQPGMPPGSQPSTQPGTVRPDPGPAAMAPSGTAPAAAPGTAADAATPPAGATAHFEPATFEASANGTFSAALVFDSGADIVAAQPLQIQYNPKVLQLTDISAGDLFSKDGVAPVFSRNIQNDQGRATVEIGRQPGATGVNAPGTLLTFSFKAIAPGATTVSVLNLTVRNSQARAIGTSHPQLAVTVK
jgi:general secretion pathway protein D